MSHYRKPRERDSALLRHSASQMGRASATGTLDHPFSSGFLSLKNIEGDIYRSPQKAARCANKDGALWWPKSEAQALL